MPSARFRVEATAKSRCGDAAALICAATLRQYQKYLFRVRYLAHERRPRILVATPRSAARTAANLHGRKQRLEKRAWDEQVAPRYRSGEPAPGMWGCNPRSRRIDGYRFHPLIILAVRESAVMMNRETATGQFQQLISSLREQLTANISRSDILRPLAWLIGLMITGILISEAEHG
jgi:hypothetical protein